MVMAIDDEILIKLIDKLYLKMNNAVEIERNIEQLISALHSIKKTPDGSLPIDRLTGNTITEERRTEVFDAIIKNSIKYVGGED